MAARWRPNGVVLSENEVARVHDLARRIFNI
jgi:hypothetical protein